MTNGTTSFKIFFLNFSTIGAKSYIVPSRVMYQLFNGANFIYRSMEIYRLFCSYFSHNLVIEFFLQNSRIR